MKFSNPCWLNQCLFVFEAAVEDGKAVAWCNAFAEIWSKSSYFESFHKLIVART